MSIPHSHRNLYRLEREISVFAAADTSSRDPQSLGQSTRSRNWSRAAGFKSDTHLSLTPPLIVISPLGTTSKTVQILCCLLSYCTSVRLYRRPHVHRKSYSPAFGMSSFGAADNSPLDPTSKSPASPEASVTPPSCSKQPSPVNSNR